MNEIAKRQAPQTGLDYVYLRNGYTEINEVDSNISIKILKPKILQLTLVHFLCWKKHVLTGQELTFLRKYLGYQTTAMSRLLGLRHSYFHKYESDVYKIGSSTDILLRLLCLEKLSPEKLDISKTLIQLSLREVINPDILECSFINDIWTIV